MKLYVGVDVSKSKLDVSLNGKNIIIENSSHGLSGLIESLKQQQSEGNDIGLVLCEALDIIFFSKHRTFATKLCGLHKPKPSYVKMC